VPGFTVSFKMPKARMIVDCGSESSGKVMCLRPAKFFNTSTES